MQRWVPTFLLGMSRGLESLVRLSNRLFQSSRSTVLGAESQVLAGVLQRQGALYQLPTPTSKKDMTCLFTSTQISPMLHCCAEPALAFAAAPGTGTKSRSVPTLQHPQLPGSLPTHAQVLAREPLLALCLARNAEVGQCLLPPKGASGATGVCLLKVSQLGAALAPVSMATSSSASPQHSLLPQASPASPAASPPLALCPALPTRPGPALQPFGGRTSATSPAPLRTAPVGTELQVRHPGWSLLSCPGFARSLTPSPRQMLIPEQGTLAKPSNTDLTHPLHVGTFKLLSS